MRRKIIEKKDNKFLVERYYKDSQVVEYVVCENYDTDTNTYINGIRNDNLMDAYFDYNLLITDYDYYLVVVKNLEDKTRKKIEKKDNKKNE